MTKTLIILGLATLLTGCATQKSLEPMGGSKADGIVEMAFSYGGLEQPVVDWDAAKLKAAERCKVWGYTDAERFGGYKQTCIGSNYYGCTDFNVIVNYQCVGGK